MATGTSTFSTSWTPPGDITGLSATVVEELSHIQLDWDASTLADVDFAYYAVYRRILGANAWYIIRIETSKSTVQWRDAFAGQGVGYEYKVLQWKAIAGDVPLPSGDGDILTAMLESDVWFVIGNENPYDEAHCFELPIFGETHTRPIQQEVFEPIVKSRKKVARGNTLGFEGTLDIRWLSEERDNAKWYLDFLSTNQGPHILKSPFGDTWRVEFDSPDYKYTGGGHLGVTMGWVEVV